MNPSGLFQPVAGPVLPWWRVRMVWLALAGPAAVVVASLATAVVAFRGADPVLHAPVADGAMAPAVQARNHAATGGPQRPAR